jgi:hypothetical protein
MALSRTAKFYRDNPEARKKRQAYQAEYDKKPEQRKKRAELNQFNRDSSASKKGDGKDAYHKNGKLVGFKSEKANRGSKSDSAGDKRARGSKK